MIHFNKIHIVLNMEPLPRKVGWNKKNKKAPEEGEKKEGEPAADKDEEMKAPEEGEKKEGEPAADK